MPSDTLEELLGPFLTAETVIVQVVATLSSMFLVYGLYTIIFGLCIHVLYRRKQSGTGLYPTCTIALFALATLFVSAEAFGLTRQSIVYFRALKARDYEPLNEYLLQDDGRTTWVAMISFSFSFMNAIADVMLIHRAYILWESNRIMLYALALPAFAINVTNFVVSVMLSVGMAKLSMRHVYDAAEPINTGVSIANAIFNALLSLLTAGRIWWVSREARKLMGRGVHTKYKAIVAAILESGLLYPTTLLASIVVPRVLDPRNEGLVPVDLGPIATLMSGLAPTLIIVRVAYGKPVESVQQMMSLRFAENGTQHGLGNMSVLQATIDIRSRPQNEVMEIDLEAPGSEGKTSGTQMT
ncbi:hypothetical protein PQX77_013197 [Marasmius sp. AFHP31]|nr:hypothetical protein PQX77_013197 [Marasmius sp. AFHP31]